MQKHLVRIPCQPVTALPGAAGGVQESLSGKEMRRRLNDRRQRQRNDKGETVRGKDRPDARIRSGLPPDLHRFASTDAPAALN